MKFTKITLIHPFAYGYIDFVVNELKERPNTEISAIATEKIKFKYPNYLVKIKNAITKIFGKNIKTTYFNNQILTQIKFEQDLIFIIRPDLLSDFCLDQLKKSSKKLIAYYYDSCKKYPRQIEIIKYFDEIYSYEDEDIAQFHFIRTNNFIYDKAIRTAEIKYDIFNISSFDNRIDEIDEISKVLSESGLNIYFLLFWYKKLNYKYLTSITEYLSLQETKELISQSKAMIDIQRKDQKGLSFRTFESLGYHKKLITTNEKVQEFDFYHPNNILVIDSLKINVAEIKKFLSLPYIEISEEIIEKYSVQTFTSHIFKL